MPTQSPPHAVVSRERWLEARRAHLAKEKELTHLREELARDRRALPWVAVEKGYAFDSPRGKVTLADLFEGRSQLIVYHYMFGPTWEEPCPSCAYVVDHIDGALPHLNARDVTVAVISRAPIATLQTFKERMGWKFPWVSSAPSDFNFDFQVSFTPEDMARGEVEYNYERSSASVEDLPGLSVFYKDRQGRVFHTYSTYARGLDILLGTYNYLDLTPKGRDEDGLAHSMAWVRYHDRYDPEYHVDPSATYAPPTGAAGAGCPCCEAAESRTPA